MSIHFRSRIRANNNIIPSTTGGGPGWCCLTNASVTSRSLCPGGYIEGAINNSQCIVAGTCRGNPIPLTARDGACCYWKNDQGSYYQLCQQVSNELDCFNLNEGQSEDLYSAFYAGKICEADGGDIVCNGVRRDSSEIGVDCLSDDNSGCFDVNKIIGNCCRGETCSLTIQAECGDGTWIPPNNGTISSCSGSPCAKLLKSTGRVSPTVASTEVNEDQYSFKKLPEIGKFYQGGIYVGTFTTNSSTVYGNPGTGFASEYIARGNQNLDPNSITSWILIADIQDFGIGSFNLDTENISQLLANEYDGVYNTNNYSSLLYDNIKKYSSNSFNDWYLPSLDELAFYFNNIKLTTEIYNSAHLSNGKYLTSTPFSLNGKQIINGKQYMYTQSAYSSEYGRVTLLEEKN